MQFALAYLSSDQQILLREFMMEEENGPASAKILSLDELKTEKIHLLFYPKDEVSEEMESLLREENRFYPVYPLHLFNLTKESFEKLSYPKALEIYKRATESWVLHHNLNLLESIFGVAKHLKGLLENDRTTFFEELWFILKTNLATKDLTLIYHDLVINEEGGKNKLVVAKVAGSRLPSPEIGGEIDNKIMNHYKDQASPHLEILSFDEVKGEIVATVGVKKSPVILMAKVGVFSKLQTSLLKSLFDGLA